MRKLILFIILLPLLSLGQTKINLPSGTQYLGITGTKVIVTNNTAITNVTELDTANTKAVGRVTVKAPIVLNIGGKTYQIGADTSTANIGLATLYKLGLKLTTSDTSGKWWSKRDTTIGGVASYYMNTLKLNIADTTAKWYSYITKEAGTDSVFGYKNGVSSFLFVDSVNPPIDTTSLSNRIDAKLNKSDSTNGGYYPYTSNPKNYSTTTGTVTSVATGLGLSGGTITTSGTLLVDTANASILSRQRAANTYQPIGSYLTTAVTSVGSGYGISGGTITTTGTLTLDSATVYSALIRKKDSLTTYATKYAENLKVDSVKKKAASDTVFYYQNGSSHFAFRDSAGSGGVTTATSPLVVTGSNMTLNQITARDSLPLMENYILQNNNLGGTLKTAPFPYYLITTSTTMANGTMLFCVVTPMKTCTVTGAVMYVRNASNAIETAASYVGFNLFTVSGANIIFNDSTTRDTALFDSGFAYKTKAWANGTKVLTAGTTYVISVVWNRVSQTTAPQLGTATLLTDASINNLHSNSNWIFGTKPQTTPYTGTTIMSSVTATQITAWIGLY